MQGSSRMDGGPWYIAREVIRALDWSGSGHSSTCFMASAAQLFMPTSSPGLGSPTSTRLRLWVAGGKVLVGKAVYTRNRRQGSEPDSLISKYPTPPLNLRADPFSLSTNFPLRASVPRYIIPTLAPVSESIGEANWTDGIYLSCGIKT